MRKTHRLQQTLPAFALGLALLVAAPAAAQTTAPGPYYALPAWDMTLPSATRFIVLSNMASEAVLDRETGLVWRRQPWEVGDWLDAVFACRGDSIAGRKGWRLPAIEELLTLIDASQSNPALPSGHPFGSNVNSALASAAYSATDAANDSAQFHYVAIASGLVSSRSKNASGFGIAWCVRGPGAR
jgi:hypothetical protein